jgi:hypothetical protein
MGKVSTGSDLICDLLKSFTDLELIIRRSGTSSDGFTPLFEFLG